MSGFRCPEAYIFVEVFPFQKTNTGIILTKKGGGLSYDVMFAVGLGKVVITTFMFFLRFRVYRLP